MMLSMKLLVKDQYLILIVDRINNPWAGYTMGMFGTLVHVGRGNTVEFL